MFWLPFFEFVVGGRGFEFSCSSLVGGSFFGVVGLILHSRFFSLVIIVSLQARERSPDASVAPTRFTPPPRGGGTEVMTDGGCLWAVHGTTEVQFFCYGILRRLKLNGGGFGVSYC